MNPIESNPLPENNPDLKQRFQKRQEEKKEKEEVNLDGLTDEELVSVIKRGSELWEKRRAAQIKEMEERHSRLNALIGAAGAAVKRRGRKPGAKNNAGD